MIQYFRQLKLQGTRENAERKKLCERMVIWAAEDSDVVPFLPIAYFHALGATRNEEGIGFGENDALALALLAAQLAQADRWSSEVIAQRTEDTPVPENPQMRAMQLSLTHLAGQQRPGLEKTWLRELKHSLLLRYEKSPLEEGSLTVDADTRENLTNSLSNNAVLPESCCTYLAIDHHDKSASQRGASKEAFSRP